jgi:5-methylcytosine-specific restriction endonuclease McrA
MGLIHRDKRWRAIRQQAKRRDNFKCMQCGSAGPLEVHHKVSVTAAPERAFELGNVTTLCSDCHLMETLRERGQFPSPARLAWASLLKEVIT